MKNHRGSLTLLAAVWALAVSCQPSGHEGGPTVLSNPQPIEPFLLTDHKGEPFSSESLKGKPTLVTFLFTNCDDSCPFLALKIVNALDLLGPELADQVNILAISTDPEGDTLEAIGEYSRRVGLENRWHYVTGTREALVPVWKSFNVAVGKISHEDSAHSAEAANDLGFTPGAGMDMEFPTEGLSEAQITQATLIIQDFVNADYDVAHSVPFWFLDADGNKKALLGAKATPQQLADQWRKML